MIAISEHPWQQVSITMFFFPCFQWEVVTKHWHWLTHYTSNWLMYSVSIKFIRNTKVYARLLSFYLLYWMITSCKLIFLKYFQFKHIMLYQNVLAIFIHMMSKAMWIHCLLEDSQTNVYWWDAYTDYKWWINIKKA